MARHKAHVPWRHLRRRYRDLLIEQQRLRRAYRDLEAQWSETYAEMVRLQEAYEPAPGTAWGIVNAAYERGLRRADDVIVNGVVEALEAWDPPSADAVTEEIRVSALRVGIDPSETGPSGIAVIKVSEDGTAEVIKEEELGK